MSPHESHFAEYASVDVLQYGELPTPDPKADELRACTPAASTLPTGS
ncbi:hypothetical protein LJ737_14795 [Hymenobacter sp. 15J16-1T3B]|nr:hypothetical protein [Hymenobacter sp. 15J16-1T3B]MCC3158516.1 hypothetical protein [Hymenobacter sp. 15J16-1T3B]